MPLQNRVDPFGGLFTDPARGLLMGNRGGRLHDRHHKLGARRWTSKQWICCRLDFNNRHRKVWGDSYSELFFLDKVTALAAGHRPASNAGVKTRNNSPRCSRAARRALAPPRWTKVCTPSVSPARPSACTVAQSTRFPTAP
jgi:hypothetical protein